MWTLYGKKIDLNDFISKHPGGDLAILLGQNNDCTTLFEQYHPNSLIRKDTFKDPFHEELLSEVKLLPNTYASSFHMFKCSVFFFLTIISWFGWNEGNWISLILLPFFHWILLANVAHDSAHFCFSKYQIINEILAQVSSPIFYNSTYWYVQHNVLHHVRTNDHELDVDLYHYEPFGRVHKKTKWNYFHNWQLVTIFFSFFFSTLAQTLIFSLRRWASIKFHQRTFLSFLIQYISSLTVLILPFFKFYFGKALMFALYPFFMASLIFMCVTQVSHIQEKTQRENKYFHWTKSQVLSSLDYSQQSNLVSFITGGLNCQGLHHCLPFLNSSRFVEFYPKYRKICKKHNIKIIEEQTYFQAFSGYISHITKLSHSD